MLKVAKSRSTDYLSIHLSYRFPVPAVLGGIRDSKLSFLMETSVLLPSSVPWGSSGSSSPTFGCDTGGCPLSRLSSCTSTIASIESSSCSLFLEFFPGGDRAKYLSRPVSHSARVKAMSRKPRLVVLGICPMKHFNPVKTRRLLRSESGSGHGYRSTNISR